MREYISVSEIQKHYLPISLKKIRIFCKTYMNCKIIGKRIFVSKKELEELLNNPEQTKFPL